MIGKEREKRGQRFKHGWNEQAQKRCDSTRSFGGYVHKVYAAVSTTQVFIPFFLPKAVLPHLATQKPS